MKQKTYILLWLKLVYESKNGLKVINMAITIFVVSINAGRDKIIPKVLLSVNINGILDRNTTLLTFMRTSEVLKIVDDSGISVILADKVTRDFMFSSLSNEGQKLFLLAEKNKRIMIQN